MTGDAWREHLDRHRATAAARDELAALREESWYRHRPYDAVVTGAEREERERQSRIEALTRAVQEQEIRVAEVAFAVGRRVTFSDLVTGPTEPAPGWAEGLAELEARMRAAEEAIADARRWAGRPKLLPGVPAAVRVLVVFLLWSLPMAVLAVVLAVAAAGGPDDTESLAVGAGCFDMPLVAFLGGLTTMLTVGSPRSRAPAVPRPVPDRTVPLSLLLGGAICGGVGLVTLVVSSIVTSLP